MRAIFLIFMIALLPLRAWLGDSMAMQVDMGAGVANKSIAGSAYPSRAEVTFSLNSETLSAPCHDPAPVTFNATDHHPNNTASASADPSVHGDCAECNICQVCHNVALSSVAVRLPALALPTQVVQSGQALFASVPRAPHQKPPIS